MWRDCLAVWVESFQEILNIEWISPSSINFSNIRHASGGIVGSFALMIICLFSVWLWFKLNVEVIFTCFFQRLIHRVDMRDTKLETTANGQWCFLFLHNLNNAMKLIIKNRSLLWLGDVRFSTGAKNILCTATQDKAIPTGKLSCSLLYLILVEPYKSLTGFWGKDGLKSCLCSSMINLIVTQKHVVGFIRRNSVVQLISFGFIDSS